MSPEASLFAFAQSQALLLVVALFGGLVLFFLKIAQHFNRRKADKLPPWRYAGYVLFLFVTLPVLGVGVTGIYLANGDRISTILAFQVGLTSPAIVQSLIIAAANNLSRDAVPTVPGQ